MARETGLMGVLGRTAVDVPEVSPLLYNLQCIHSSGVECYSNLFTSSARFKIK